MQDEETTPPRQTVPRRGANGVMRAPDEVDRAIARRLRETYGSDNSIAIAVLARALDKLEEDSGSRSNEETAILLALPERIGKVEQRVTKVETPVAIGTWIVMTLAGGLVGGIIWASHVISSNSEERGSTTEILRTLKGDVEELKKDVRYLERK